MAEIDDEVCGVSVVDLGPDDETIGVVANVEGVEVVLFVARRSIIVFYLIYLQFESSPH